MFLHHFWSNSEYLHMISILSAMSHWQNMNWALKLATLKSDLAILPE